jgi:hypothetical protein
MAKSLLPKKTMRKVGERRCVGEHGTAAERHGNGPQWHGARVAVTLRWCAAARAATPSRVSSPAAVPIADHERLVAYAPAAVRRLRVFGAHVEAALVPARRQRVGAAVAARPPFARSRAARILADECIWRGDGMALTPNAFPFAQGQRLLWPLVPLREPDAALWQAAFAWADAAGGAALVNNVGAASSIGRAHAHLCAERMPFLAGLPEQTGPHDVIDLPDGVALVAKAVPFCLLGVRGPAAARALAVVRLAEARLTAAWNVVAQDGATWLLPRRAETPAPHFPHALGAAELWGRWCYVDEAAFAAAREADLEAALVAAGCPPLA